MKNIKKKEIGIYGSWAGNPKGVQEDITKCIESVMSDGEWIPHQCNFKRGYGENELYCKRHAKRIEENKKFIQHYE